MRVQPKLLYSADGAIDHTIQQMRYDPSAGDWDDDCDTIVELQDPRQTVHVKCEPDANSGRGDEGESSPPVGIIGLSNGGPALNEFAYQQYENSIIRIDGGVYSSTPMRFVNGSKCTPQNSNCQQLNLCPRNAKRVTDAVLVRNTATVTSLSAPFRATDVGAPILGTGIPTGTTVASVPSQTQVTMSRNATSSGIRPIQIREDYPKLQEHCYIPTELEDPTGEHRRKGKVTAVPRPGEAESCDEDFIVALWKNCDSTYIPDPTVGTDPNYPVDKFSGFALKAVPACGDPSNNRPVELTEGRYNNAAALTALTTGCDKLLWFKPGTYYFDFDDSNPVWTIGNTNMQNLTVVGGAKTWSRDPFFACLKYNNQTNKSTVTADSAVFSGANGYWLNSAYNLPYGVQITVSPINANVATFTGPPLTNNFGNCNQDAGPVKQGVFTISPNNGNNPIGSLCDPSTHVDHAGVEFIFGRASRVVVTDGKTEICSPVVGTRQQVAVYGVTPAQAKGQIQAQSGCILVQPYTPSSGSGCALIKAPQGNKPALVIHGTIYAPSAAIDLSLQGVSYQVVSRGIIARVIALGVSPSSNFNKPVIYSPNFGSIPGAPRKMVLTACLDRHCDDGGTPKIRAVVRIKDDDDFGNPGVPGFKVFIDSWSVL